MQIIFYSKLFFKNFKTLSIISLCSAYLLAFQACSKSNMNAEVKQSGNGKTDTAGRKSVPPSKEFSDYWYSGKAELNKYELTQARYGELRKGSAVAIFVTEDFLIDKQVKLESDPVGRKYTSVMKLNLQKNFITGIYPYSMMSSAFVPVDYGLYPNMLKATNTVTEWCGQVFSQLNFIDTAFQLQEYSYFEREADTKTILPKAFTEESIFLKIRIAPQDLPQGDFPMIPNAFSRRLRHKPASTLQAVAVLTKGDSIWHYAYKFKDDDRSFVIDFEAAFPHKILGWSETYKDGFGANTKVLTTTAKLTHTFIDDYWKHNAIGDTVLRENLGLRTGL